MDTKAVEPIYADECLLALSTRHGYIRLTWLDGERGFLQLPKSFLHPLVQLPVPLLLSLCLTILPTNSSRPSSLLAALPLLFQSLRPAHHLFSTRPPAPSVLFPASCLLATSRMRSAGAAVSPGPAAGGTRAHCHHRARCCRQLVNVEYCGGGAHTHAQCRRPARACPRLIPAQYCSLSRTHAQFHLCRTVAHR